MLPLPPRKQLPLDPSIEHLRKQAKRLAAAQSMPLAKAQHHLAGDYGCASWADLLRVVESLQRGSDQLTGGHTPMTPLPEAANRNDLPRVMEILAAGSFTRHDLDQALARAVLRFSQRRKIAEVLIEHGADPDGQYGGSYGPIVLVTGECLDPEGLEFLIRHGADVRFAPVQSKYGPTSPLIATLGTYARGVNDLKHRCIDLLLAHGALLPSSVTPAMLAIHRGDVEALDLALSEHPASVHQHFPDMPFGNLRLAGGTLLHLAVEVGEMPCIERLLALGADLNARSLVSDDCGGQTPIFHAVATIQGAGFPILEYLLRQPGRWIDHDVSARLMVFGQATPRTMTVQEYARWTMSEAPADWPRSSDQELDLLRS
jgi:Ankyrin repeat